MTNKEKARKIALYAGNKAMLDNNYGYVEYEKKIDFEKPSTIVGVYCSVVYVVNSGCGIVGVSAKTVHPILRTIDQITDEEIEVLNNLPCNNFTEIDRAYVVHEFVGYFLLDKDEADYLRSIGIDCDGLIEAGVAVKEEE